MKGVNYMEIFTAVVVMLLIFAVAFLYWDKFHKEASVQGPKALEGVMAGFLIYSLAERASKKGIVITTMLLTTVIFVVIITFFILMIYLSLTAEAPSGSSSFFYGIFDAILRNLPWVK